MLRPSLRLLPVLALTACAAAPDDPVRVAVTDTAATPTILGGTASTAAEDAVVMLVVTDPAQTKRLGICTATMLAPNLILTARHCVSRNDGDSIACDASGTAIVGGTVYGDFDPAQLFVFTGATRPPYVGDEPPFDAAKWAPAGQGAEILDDSAGNLCNHDLALVRLKAPIANVPVAAVRLDGNATVGETLRTVGWGVTSTVAEPDVRQTRSGVTVKRVGPDAAIPVLTSSEFLFDESICLGDSGGPIFDAATGAVVGVVSRGGNGEDPSDTDYAKTCVGANNLGTKLAPFKSLILGAYTKAGATARLEAKDEDDGCRAAAGHAADPTTLVVALAAVLVARRRRQSTSTAPAVQPSALRG